MKSKANKELDECAAITEEILEEIRPVLADIVDDLNASRVSPHQIATTVSMALSIALGEFCAAASMGEAIGDKAFWKNLVDVQMDACKTAWENRGVQ